MTNNENTGLYWLSFVEKMITADKFLGVNIVRASSFEEAVMISHILRINPGGECVGGGPLPAFIEISENDIGCLLNKDEATALRNKIDAVWQQEEKNDQS
jgi:hypothetical protein